MLVSKRGFETFKWVGISTVHRKIHKFCWNRAIFSPGDHLLQHVERNRHDFYDRLGRSSVSELKPFSDHGVKNVMLAIPFNFTLGSVRAGVEEAHQAETFVFLGLLKGNASFELCIKPIEFRLGSFKVLLTFLFVSRFLRDRCWSWRFGSFLFSYHGLSFVLEPLIGLTLLHDTFLGCHAVDLCGEMHVCRRFSRLNNVNWFNDDGRCITFQYRRAIHFFQVPNPGS